MKGGIIGGQPGDWVCPGCADLQFARNATCRLCNTPRPEGKRGRAAASPQRRKSHGQRGARKPGDWICNSCGDLQFARNIACRRCGKPADIDADIVEAPEQHRSAKPGDWFCPNCRDLQFARNTECRKCSTPKPDDDDADDDSPHLGVAESGRGRTDSNGGIGGGPGQTPKPGDWHCPKCDDLVFARNAACRRCGTTKPADVLGAEPGDWICADCGDLQFKRNVKCRKCSAPKPVHVNFAGVGGSSRKGGNGPIAKPGDWHCPGCSDLQFARNAACRRCGTERPSDGTGEVTATASAPWFAKPGDWVCPACGDLQFKRNSACRKCSTARPEDDFQEEPMEDDDGEFQEPMRSKPRGAYSRHDVEEPQTSKLSVEARLGHTVQVSNVPDTMTAESLIMILTGMFGKVRGHEMVMDTESKDPVATVEFVEPASAAKAIAAEIVQFGENLLTISPSEDLVGRGTGGVATGRGESSRVRSRSRQRKRPSRFT